MRAVVFPAGAANSSQTETVLDAAGDRRSAGPALGPLPGPLGRRITAIFCAAAAAAAAAAAGRFRRPMATEAVRVGTT